MVVQVRGPRDGTCRLRTMKFAGRKKAVPRTPVSGGFIDFGPYGTKVRLNLGAPEL